MPERKIVCLGAGSLYFRRAIADLLMSQDLSGSEIVLYDLVHEKSERVARMGQRLAAEAGTGFRVRAARELADAVDGADYAISSIGGSGAGITPRVYMSHHHLEDVRIGAKYGVQQIIADTCGPGAMMMAFRAIPAYIEICREMEKRCPQAMLFNHSNPMAVLCRAMRKYTDINVIGVCHGVQGGIRHAAAILDIPANELETVWIGTNHYYWFTRMRHQAADVMPEFWKRVRKQKPAAAHQMSAALSQVYGNWIVYPEDDHVIEFYPYLNQGSDPTNLPFGMSEHGFGKRLQPLYAGEETLEEIRQRDQAASRQEMLKAYGRQLNAVQLPQNATDPISGEGTARLISDMATGRRNVHICNVPNQGAVTNLPQEAVLELEAVTDSAGVRPVCAGDAPPVLEALLRKRITWQELVADAAAQGDRKLALQAMQVDEAAIPPKESEKMLGELMKNSKGMLPTFEKRRKSKR